MTWTKFRKALTDLSQEDLIKLLKGLNNLSPQNKAWLQTHVLPDEIDPAYLESCRKKVSDLVYKPTSALPRNPRFQDAKKVISEYKAATKDQLGTLDLMLTFVERGHAFTNDFLISKIIQPKQEVTLRGSMEKNTDDSNLCSLNFSMSQIMSENFGH